ncbi:EF-hand domain-containing protein [Sphingomonas sp.]|uniref:EF-hand domain-containing protein n=1 Tax=Sphingomonas sp. TaxID=28214 RepID=UPI00389E0601
MTRFLILACGTAALGSAATAQTAPKPITRADYIKIVDTRFNTVDANHDGKVTRDELIAQQQREMANGKAVIAKRLQDQFRQLDTNKDGKLTIDEFVAGAPPIRTAETPDQLLNALDTNHDGKISTDEFRAPNLAKFNKVDANHDGVATVQEQQAAARSK